MSSSPIRVGVLGANGRLGKSICEAVEAAPDLVLVAKIGRSDSLDQLIDAGTEVAIDVTHPEAVMKNLQFMIANGIHAVIGTSGFDSSRIATVKEWFSRARADLGVVIAPNFAIGAILCIRFAEHAARYFESVELIELHHPKKIDAPSGTATHAASLIASARESAGIGQPPDATTAALDGARGACVEGIRVHSIRLSGLIAHQEVLMGNPGEVFTIRHDSTDRVSFVPGVLLAIRNVKSRSGLTVGIDSFLGF